MFIPVTIKHGALPAGFCAMAKKLSGLTRWIDDRRSGLGRDMSPEVEAKLWQKLFKTLEARLRPLVTSRFGLPTAEDMASEQMAHLFERVSEDGIGLPAFVSDSKTLFVWMFVTARSRFWDRIEVITGRPAEHGGSGVRDGQGALDERGVQVLRDRTHRGDEFVVEELGIEEVELLKAALSDCRCWFRTEAGRDYAESTPLKDWAYAFEQLFFYGRRRGEVAAELDIVEGNLTRWLQRVPFCYARRLNHTPGQFAKRFKDDRADRWMASLEAALSRNDA